MSVDSGCQDVVPRTVDLRLLGKERGLGGARYPLICHGLDTAAAAILLWRDFVSPGLRARLASVLGLSEDEASSVLALWASLHDVGKLTPSFQRQVALPPGYPDDLSGEGQQHANASYAWVPGGLMSLGYPDVGRAYFKKGQISEAVNYFS